MSEMRVVVGHLYPDYLNIYADRGNMAVLARRAAWRGIRFEIDPIGMEKEPRPGAHDLYYIGGGQDREQALVARDLVRKGEALRQAGGSTAAGTAKSCRASGCFPTRRWPATGE